MDQAGRSWARLALCYPVVGRSFGGVTMPTTIGGAFAAADILRYGCVKWRERPKESAPGVYVVSLTESPDTCDRKLACAPLAAAEFERWLGECPELTLDSMRPTVQQLMDRIQRFWIPDEVILYIGLAGTSLSARLDQYYRTKIGARRPHSGGYFLKLLSNLDQLWVHYARCPSPVRAEQEMLRRFCENVSDDSKQALHDHAHPFPFANLEWPRGKRKVHGLNGTRRD